MLQSLDKDNITTVIISAMVMVVAITWINVGFKASVLEDCLTTTAYRWEGKNKKDTGFRKAAECARLYK